ncbi:MAG: DUF167 family protein [Endozoicomonas sp.]
MTYYRWQDDNLYLSCHLQPKAKNDEFTGLHGDSLKIRITAPPVDGKANSYLVRFVAKAFGVAKNRVKIVSGELSREKRLCITEPAKIPETLDIQRLDKCCNNDCE